MEFFSPILFRVLELEVILEPTGSLFDTNVLSTKVTSSRRLLIRMKLGVILHKVHPKARLDIFGLDKMELLGLNGQGHRGQFFGGWEVR